MEATVAGGFVFIKAIYATPLIGEVGFTERIGGSPIFRAFGGVYE
jgi:hypothetical protein